MIWLTCVFRRFPRSLLENEVASDRPICTRSGFGKRTIPRVKRAPQTEWPRNSVNPVPSSAVLFHPLICFGECDLYPVLSSYPIPCLWLPCGPLKPHLIPSYPIPSHPIPLIPCIACFATESCPACRVAGDLFCFPCTIRSHATVCHPTRHSPHPIPSRAISFRSVCHFARELCPAHLGDGAFKRGGGQHRFSHPRRGFSRW